MVVQVVENRSLETLVTQKFASDFDLRFYHPETVVKDDVIRHVGAFLGEKMLQPRQESIWIGKNGELDPNYLSLMQNSIIYWRARGDELAANRFEHELLGMQNMMKLILTSYDVKESMPIVINASDPGDFYVDQDGIKKSGTFVGLLDHEEGNGWRYSIFSLPTRYIGLDEHWEMLQEFGNLQRTREMLGYGLENLTAEELVAYPVLMNSLVYQLDDLAKRLGYESWDRVVEMVANQMKLEQDDNALVRREAMIQDFTKRILRSVRDRESDIDQQALVNAMADIFALEAGKEYLGLGEEQILTEIAKMADLAKAERCGGFETQVTRFDYHKDYSLTEIKIAEMCSFRESIIARFASNPLAREARATGCGGSGSKLAQQPFNLIGSKYTFEVISPTFDYQYSYTDSIDTTSGEPNGMYPEGIYTPGHCRGCNTDRQKIWHTADGGCDCCTVCERRLAGGE